MVVLHFRYDALQCLRYPCLFYFESARRKVKIKREKVEKLPMVGTQFFLVHRDQTSNINKKLIL